MLIGKTVNSRGVQQRNLILLGFHTLAKTLEQIMVCLYFEKMIFNKKKMQKKDRRRNFTSKKVNLYFSDKEISDHILQNNNHY